MSSKRMSQTFASQDQVRRVFTGVNRFSADRFARVEWRWLEVDVSFAVLERVCLSE